MAAGRTNTFLGECYRRIARRHGTKRAIVAVGRSILIIIWHLLSDPTVHYQDLGSGFYDTRINAEHRKRNHIRQLGALGYKVSLEPCRLTTTIPYPDPAGCAPPEAAACLRTVDSRTSGSGTPCGHRCRRWSS